MKRLNVLVVEDEELARERLARLIRERPDLALAGACRNCDEAQDVIERQSIDLALLDIQMPGTNGITFTQKLQARNACPPIVIFVTAHRRYACDAFEIQAADYLLKPFDRSRLAQALDNARSRFEAREALLLAEKAQSIEGAVDVSANEPKPASSGRLLVRNNDRFLIVRNEQIDWVEADGRECVLHCGDKAHRVNGPFADLVARLCTDRFVQVSRSGLINIDRITQLQELFKGDLIAVMKSGQEVHVSRRFRSLVMDRLAG